MSDDPHITELRLKRLKFRASHRGFREADILLGLFAEAHAANLDAVEIDHFEALLEEADASIYAWVIGREVPPPPFATPLLARIQAFVPEAHRRLLSAP